MIASLPLSWCAFGESMTSDYYQKNVSPIIIKNRFKFPHVLFLHFLFHFYIICFKYSNVLFFSFCTIIFNKRDVLINNKKAFYYFRNNSPCSGRILENKMERIVVKWTYEHSNGFYYLGCSGCEIKRKVKQPTYPIYFIVMVFNNAKYRFLHLISYKSSDALLISHLLCVRWFCGLIRPLRWMKLVLIPCPLFCLTCRMHTKSLSWCSLKIWRICGSSMYEAHALTWRRIFEKCDVWVI